MLAYIKRVTFAFESEGAKGGTTIRNEDEAIRHASVGTIILLGSIKK